MPDPSSPVAPAPGVAPSSTTAPRSGTGRATAPGTGTGGGTAPGTATAWAFLTPALLLLGLSVLIPGAMALLISFTRTGLDVGEPLTFVGLANLRRLLVDPMLRRVAATTFLYLIGIVPLVVTGSLALAVLVNRQLPAVHWIRAAFYTPVLVSLVVAAIAFRWLYAENGLINGWLAALLGSRFEPIGFLTSPLLALPSVMVVTLWKGLGYYMVIFLGGLQGIPQELYEAAALDGSEGWRRHRDITVPLLRPYVTLVAVLSAIAATKVFEEMYLMTQGGPADATRTIVYYVYDQAFSELEISYACTVGLALFMVVLLLSLLRWLLVSERGLV
ncbi:MAG: carbohydrate ABC transporter permease [Synechococcaceae cyanobacterium]